MKYKIAQFIILITLLIQFMNVYAQQTTKIIKPEDSDVFVSLDSKLILRRLFDNPQFDSTGAALWSTNYKDGMEMPISFDGKCHTNIDTIMYFKDHKNRECAAIIFTHYNYQYSDSPKVWIDGSHFTGVPLGIALFNKQDDKTWKIYCFEKHFSDLGYFGKYRTGRQDQGKISLRKTGDNWTCLSLKQGIGGSGGIFWGYESLYSIEEFLFRNQEQEDEVTEWYDNDLLQNLLTYNYYLSSSTPYEKSSIKTVELKTVKKKNNYYDIELLVTRNGKKYIERYFYSERYNRYIKK